MSPLSGTFQMICTDSNQVEHTTAAIQVTASATEIYNALVKACNRLREGIMVYEMNTFYSK